MIVFITGGAKNGKSTLAQNIAVKLAKGGIHYYIATMIPSDNEDEDRISRHQKDREGMDFETMECGRNILSCLESADTKGTFLLDSITALLLNELFPNPTSCRMDVKAAEKCVEDLKEFAQSVENIVLVSDYICSDAARYDEVTETYRQWLAKADREIVSVSDIVLEVSAGNVIVHKGEFERCV